MAGQPLLRVSGLSLRFGGIQALVGVGVEVEERSIVGLIGPNGAGKTTLFNCISRLYRPDAGDILFRGRSILGRPPHRIAALGIARTFQNLALFPSLTVLDNVMIGAHCRSRGDFLSDALRLPWVGRAERRLRRRAEALLVEVGLEDVAAAPAGALTFAMQKRVELARALAVEPALLLLDEPAGGLNHAEVEDLSRQIRALRDQRRLAVLLVEHHVQMVMAVSDKVVAFDFGRKIAEGPPAAVQAHPDVIRAYLGAAA
jgi:branched-chain amino acid transport system ATP-binding protein